MPLPPFARGRRWHRRSSAARQRRGERTWHDLDDDFEYARCPQRPSRWHRIDWRRGYYQDIDPTTGEPLPGSHGQWRSLK